MKLISHASRTLLPTENNYSVIEKESLGIVFALEKFQGFLHGRRIAITSYFGIQKRPTDPYSYEVAAIGNHLVELRFQNGILAIK